jgi:hypothetical protein
MGVSSAGTESIAAGPSWPERGARALRVPRLCRIPHRLHQRIRGLLSEFGHVLPLKADTVGRRAGLLLKQLPGWANRSSGTF